MDHSHSDQPGGYAPGCPPDHALLVAGAAIHQAATATAVLAERIERETANAPGSAVHAIVGMFVEPAGDSPAGTLGSFHPRIARSSSGKARSRFMKAGFTLAF